MADKKSLPVGYRSLAGGVVDALGNTTTFVYRVIVLHKKGGNFISYRGAYEVAAEEDGVAFIEKNAGRSPHDIDHREFRWESPKKAQYVLNHGQTVGFSVAEEGSFVYQRNATAQELAKHLDGIQASMSPRGQ